MTPRHLSFLLAALLCLPGSAARAASAVEALEADLAARRAAIDADGRALNADCKAVLSTDTAKVAECRSRQADLLRRMGEYKADRARLDTLRDERADAIVKAEQEAYAKGKEAWTREQKRLVAERLGAPNRTAGALADSLGNGTPAPQPGPRPTRYPPPNGFSTLSPGDIILVAAEDRPWWNTVDDAMAYLSSHLTRLGDDLTSVSRSPASHSIIYLKEVNGTKLFLDHTAEKGSRVISEKQFFEEYKDREFFKAALAQPVRPDEALKIWKAAKTLTRKDVEAKRVRSSNLFDQTAYGLGEDMVCSEADRWVLAQAGRDLPDTKSPVKRWLGIDYGPANFYEDKQNFVVTPLFAPAEKP
jgi:hypothetical protein